VHAGELSYFSRLMETESFGRAALVETHRRGVETTSQVVAVTDGAVWEQGFIDYHREDAARVLDFPHAAGYVAQVGSAVWGEGTEATKEWLSKQLHILKHEGPTEVLSELRMQVQEHPELPKLSESLAYLEKREAHMQYPMYSAQGWPIGSGAVESGNKVVVETRLKGAGMHWAPGNVDPMVALHNALCSDRWPEARSQILAQQHQHALQTRQVRREHRLTARAAAPATIEPLLSPHLSQLLQGAPRYSRIRFLMPMRPAYLTRLRRVNRGVQVPTILGGIHLLAKPSTASILRPRLQKTDGHPSAG